MVLSVSANRQLMENQLLFDTQMKTALFFQRRFDIALTSLRMTLKHWFENVWLKVIGMCFMVFLR